MFIAVSVQSMVSVATVATYQVFLMGGPYDYIQKRSWKIFYFHLHLRKRQNRRDHDRSTGGMIKSRFFELVALAYHGDDDSLTLAKKMQEEFPFLRF